MYILPAMVLTHPDMVKYILRYRSAFAQQAMELAQSMEHEGEFATIVNVRLKTKISSFQLHKNCPATAANQAISLDNRENPETAGNMVIKTKLQMFLSNAFLR